MKKLLIAFLLFGTCLPAVAADGEGSPVSNFVRKVGTFLDTMAMTEFVEL